MKNDDFRKGFLSHLKFAVPMIALLIVIIIVSFGISKACDPLVDPDCGEDPIDPPCPGCYPTPTPTPPPPEPYCGDGNIDFGEECERPNTANNINCLQSQHNCLEKKYGTRDSYGNCDSSCDCVYDSFSYTCSVGHCSAECDTSHTCPATNCDYLDGCVGRDYYDYSDVSNSCTSECTCTHNTCGMPIIYHNDSRCGECSVDGDCDFLDSDFCVGDVLKHVEGVCNASFRCVSGTPVIVEDCNLLDRVYCDNSFVMRDDGYCFVEACHVNISSVMDCNDGLYCNGVESCSSGNCVAGTPVVCSDDLFCTLNERCDESTDRCVYDQRDCSANNIFGIATCTNIPDDNPLTWDYRAAFTSVCDENNDVCTSGSSAISHVCSVDNCGAECDSTHGCAYTYCNYLDGCYGLDYYDYGDVANACLGSCECENNACTAVTIYPNDPRCGECSTDDDCNRLDSTYCSGDKIMHVEGICMNFNCTLGTPSEVQDCNDADRNYCQGTFVIHAEGYCRDAECHVNTTTLTNCDDGLYCNGVESCSSGNCVAGTPVDCSVFNIGEIATCSNIPDGNPYTWDFRAPYISTCNETLRACNVGSNQLVHSCDKERCDAACTESETEVRSCGYGGTQFRECNASCSWGEWSECEGEGECMPSSVDTRACGLCGTQSRICMPNYLWGSWRDCVGEGICVPDSSEMRSCGLGGRQYRICSQSCYWSDWGNCTDEGECYPGEIEERLCLDFGTQYRKCQSNFKWSEWSECKFPKTEIKMNQLQIINEDCIKPGEDLIALIDFKLLGYHDDYIKITAVIPELSLRNRIGPFKVDHDEDISKVFLMTIPEDTPEGVYDVRFTINNDIRRVKHRTIIVRNQCCRECTCISECKI